MTGGVVPDVLIRGLDDAMHAELKRRAELAGVSMQVYIRRLLAEHVRHPDVEEWLAQLEQLSVVEGLRGADAVAAAREDMP